MKLLFNLLAVILFFLHKGVSGVEADEVSVMEGDSVILHTNVTTTQYEITWYFNKTQIVEITRDPNKICRDYGRFSEGLKLDHQTGSLTITNITNTDSGVYELQIRSSDKEKIFNVTVRGVSAAERDEMNKKSVKEGDSVRLDPGEIKNPNDVMMWYFNDTIAVKTGDQSEFCTDVQCKERFRDRLKLDNQTGSLTITNTRTTDSGLYVLRISSSTISIIRSFSVTVIAVTDSGLSKFAVGLIGAVVGAAVGAGVVLLVVAVVHGVCFCKKTHAPVQQNDDDNL